MLEFHSLCTGNSSGKPLSSCPSTVNHTLFFDSLVLPKLYVNVYHIALPCTYLQSWLTHRTTNFLQIRIMFWRLLSTPLKMLVELIVATDKPGDPHWFLDDFLKFKLEWKIQYYPPRPKNVVILHVWHLLSISFCAIKKSLCGQLSTLCVHSFSWAQVAGSSCLTRLAHTSLVSCGWVRSC